MLNTYSYEDKNDDLAFQKCINDLNVTEEDLYIKTTEIEGKLFKAKKVQITVLLKSDVKQYMKDFLKTIALNMGIELHIEIKEKDGIYSIVLVSDQNSILIGKDGRTLNALQLLLRQALLINTDFNIKINIDAGNYKAKKVKNFEYGMKKIIKEVQHTKIDAKLDPMNSYERRIVHNLAQKFNHIVTVSSGEGKERHITIKYRED